MNTEIWVVLIPTLGSLIGVIITSIITFKKQQQTQKVHNQEYSRKVDEYKDLTSYKIEQLEKKQDKYNNLQERTWRLEGNVEELNKEMRSVREHLLNRDEK